MSKTTGLGSPAIVPFGVIGAAGLGVVLTATYSGARTLDADDQAAWATAAAIGTTAVAVSAAWWVALLRRVVAIRVAATTAALGSRLSSAVTAVADGSTRRLVAAPAMQRFHLEGCPLTVGKQVDAATRADHERAGRRSCGVCDA